MEAIIENLTKNEFFGAAPNYSENLYPGVNQNAIKVGRIIVWMIVGGVIVYIFRHDIEAFFLGLMDKSSDESGSKRLKRNLGETHL